MVIFRDPALRSPVKRKALHIRKDHNPGKGDDMKQRYKDLDHDLCVLAVINAFEDKWDRQDVQGVVNKYGGITRGELMRDVARGHFNVKMEAAHNIAYELEQRVLDLMDGDPDALDLEPVYVRQRRDGMTGKVRDIADLCIFHQIFGHLVRLGLDPLFQARLLPQQHASIPDHGPVALKQQVERYMRATSLHINAALKKDIHHAYQSTQYSVVIRLLQKEIPSARWIFAILEAFARIAPGGHLIIGGYIDAWLFNFVMSYALRYVLGLRKTRRGKSVPLVARAPSYMDDVGLMGRRVADIKSAARQMGKWMEANLGVTWKDDSVLTEFLTVREERQRKKAPTPAGRGCPGLDLGGYVMHRTYTTIRPRIYIRARRSYMRGARSAEATGTINVQRARRMNSYYGYYKHTASAGAKRKYNVEHLQKLAGHVVAYRDREKARQQKRRVNLQNDSDLHHERTAGPRGDRQPPGGRPVRPPA